MKWKDKLLRKLENDFSQNNPQGNSADKLVDNFPNIAIHLAIFSEPILSKLLAGQKTIESRFSANRVSPFGRIEHGDLVIVKKSGGPIVAVFIAGNVKNYSNLTTAKIKSFRDEFSEKLGLSINDTFWTEKSKSKYATFIKVKEIIEIPPFFVDKKDRTGWVIIKSRQKNEIF